MNPKSLAIILILSGGMFNGTLVLEEENQLTRGDNVFNHISELFLDKYNVNIYISACDKVMYEDGTFYSDLDVIECKNSVTQHYDQKMSEFVKPEFEYFSIKDTGYRAEYTENIYKIDVFGVYCDNAGFTNWLMNSERCSTEDMGSLYMAKNTISREWGYAGNGFETTTGKYLK